MRFWVVGAAVGGDQRAAMGGDRCRPGGAGVVGELFEFARPGPELAGVPVGAACRLQAVQRGQALYSGMPEPPEVVHRSVCIGGTGSGNTFDGSAIEWVAGSNKITPGQSLSGFSFTSTDSPG